jgi:hypothetical protein
MIYDALWGDDNKSGQDRGSGLLLLVLCSPRLLSREPLKWGGSHRIGLRLPQTGTAQNFKFSLLAPSAESCAY